LREFRILKRLGLFKAKLCEEEKARLIEISEAITSSAAGGGTLIGQIQRHFNAAAISTAATPTDVMEMRDAQAAFINMGQDDLLNKSMAYIKLTDVFTRAARQVANDDAKLAALLPDTLDREDVALLEKCKFLALAALVQAKP
jgi:hypothetical protein